MDGATVDIIREQFAIFINAFNPFTRVSTSRKHIVMGAGTLGGITLVKQKGLRVFDHVRAHQARGQLLLLFSRVLEGSLVGPLLWSIRPSYIDYSALGLVSGPTCRRECGSWSGTFGEHYRT